MCDKLRDDVRTLHEAYQFLSRKYILAMQRLEAMKTEGLSNEGYQEENNNDISEDVDAYEDVFMNLE